MVGRERRAWTLQHGDKDDAVLGVRDGSSIVECGDHAHVQQLPVMPVPVPDATRVSHQDIIGLLPAFSLGSTRPSSLLPTRFLYCNHCDTHSLAYVRRLSPRATQVVTTSPPVLLPHHPLPLPFTVKPPRVILKQDDISSVS
jgi:hypothetical protein